VRLDASTYRQDWVDGKDKAGRRRLDNAGDFVRLEIAAASQAEHSGHTLRARGMQRGTVARNLSDWLFGKWVRT